MEVYVHLVPCVSCGNPVDQIEAARNEFNNTVGPVAWPDAFWITVSPESNWSNDKLANRKFLEDMVTKSRSQTYLNGVPIGETLPVMGIFTDVLEYNSVFGSDYTKPSELGLRVWY